MRTVRDRRTTVCNLGKPVLRCCDSGLRAHNAPRESGSMQRALDTRTCLPCPSNLCVTALMGVYLR